MGDAWARAWAEGVADANPYLPPRVGVSLDFGYQASSNPSTDAVPAQNAAGFHHPSVYGDYLSALVLFEKVTGHDVRKLGATEQAASALGISPDVALKLQTVAYEEVIIAKCPTHQSDSRSLHS